VTKSGPLTPYLGVDGSYLKEGLIGHIAPNAVADLILLKGNPLNDLSFLSNPSKNIQLIMKDGIIYKNTLH
jgi:imidazolonepropionase-like amidohydrolase